jgi:hypothetical protein
MESESRITPEPTEVERRAILAALKAQSLRPAAYASRWRQAALEEGVFDGARDDPDGGALGN